MNPARLGRVLTRGAVAVSLTVAPAVASAGGTQPGVVGVTVSGVRSERGHVPVAVCQPWDLLREHCAHNGLAPAHPGAVVVRVAGVPPGVYAVQAWHDEDDNGRIRRNFLGVPREGVGFSNDPSFRFGPPRFEDAAFGVGPDGGRAALTLATPGLTAGITIRSRLHSSVPRRMRSATLK